MDFMGGHLNAPAACHDHRAGVDNGYCLVELSELDLIRFSGGPPESEYPTVDLRG
jgi:hypothetical protein